MKTLLLIRHAKSDWKDHSLSDFDRPLNERGKRNAPDMAARLLAKNIPIDLFVSSPALRAKTTAGYFAEAYNRKSDDILFYPELYLASPPTFISVIQQIPEEYQHVALFSHNSGITDFANQLTHARIDELPTCGIFAVKMASGTWKDFNSNEKEFWFCDYPKNQPH